VERKAPLFGEAMGVHPVSIPSGMRAYLASLMGGSRTDAEALTGFVDSGRRRGNDSATMKLVPPRLLRSLPAIVGAVRRRRPLAALLTVCSVLLSGCTGKSGPSDGGRNSGPCDPLSPLPATLGTIIGVGKDPQSIIYVADDAPDIGQDRVFVSNGDTLYRKNVIGSGQNGGPPNAEYTFSFQDSDVDASDARALLIQVRSGAVTAMALGPGDSRSFYAPDAGDESLTVVGESAIAGFKVQDLPAQVEYVGDVSNGEAIVVTEPIDPWGYTGFRLFYGTAGQMVECPVVTYNRGDISDEVTFTLGMTTYTATFGFASGFVGLEGGLTGPGPSTLETGGGGTLQITLRMPTPTSLSGFSFTCLE
jgi:hypothetical protein